MDFKDLLTDDGAVSPVIGVILMVAITVILAAVIGTFVLGLGDQVGDTAPQASFAFDYNQSTGDHLNITHESGDSINSDRLKVSTGVPIYGIAEGDDNGAANSRTWSALNGNNTVDVQAGSSVTIEPDGDSLHDQTVRIVWTSDSGSTSATLQKWSGPNA
ncbi:type IV pilin [Haloferax sp. YSMS24]|uniref:type IV pilin n=1 Tax=Haloferax sp. YSMS24 TaxID=3388425 RepID=UPI00398D34B8